jgi:hypothetical protein
MRKHTRHVRFGVLGTIAALTISTAAIAATTVRVTQNSTNWGPLDPRFGGAFEFTEDYEGPPGLEPGSLELTTDGNNASKIDYFTFDHAGTLLDDVATLSYWTYQPQPPVQAAVANASYQVQIDIDGDLNDGMGFTTLVFEPYWNPDQQPIVPNVWQEWDVDMGLFWSSRTVTEGSCALVAGAGGPPLYTLAQVQAMCPDAVVIGIGVNVGTFNPNYTVATDGVRFNDTIYDFEVGLSPETEGDCKKGGWRTFDDPSFTNQGQCISWVRANPS